MGIGAHQIGCPVGTDGDPMGNFPDRHRPHRAPIGESSETEVADNFSEANQKPNTKIQQQEPFRRN